MVELGDRLGAAFINLGRVDRTFLGRDGSHLARKFYLCSPFLLSWSQLEPMTSGCVVYMRTHPVEEVLQDGDKGLLVVFLLPRLRIIGLIEGLSV